MTWLGRYRLRSFVRNSTWIVPLFAMVGALILVHPLHWLEIRLGLHSEFDPETALTVLGTMASAMFTFIIFVSTALLLAVQLASAQLTPRIIGFLFQDPYTKIALGVFTFAFTFTLSVLARVTDSVPPLTGLIAAYGCLGSLCVFLSMIDHVSRVLHANGALRSIGSAGQKVVESVYPEPVTAVRVAPKPEEVITGSPTQTVSSRKDGFVLAFGAKELVRLAVNNNCLIEVALQVGDFVTKGDPLFRIYAPDSRQVPEKDLREMIAVGPRRTFEQDPAFAMRIIVDIASRALSSAINDPTSAVLAIDEIYYMLRTIGRRRLVDRVIMDPEGNARLAYYTPDWGDFVQLGVTEIRQYGGSSIQVTRRLRAMLEDLIRTMPVHRVPALQRELSLLHRSADRYFAEPEDRELAEACDPQGVGGRQRRNGTAVTGGVQNAVVSGGSAPK